MKFIYLFIFKLNKQVHVYKKQRDQGRVKKSFNIFYMNLCVFILSNLSETRTYTKKKETINCTKKKPERFLLFLFFFTVVCCEIE